MLQVCLGKSSLCIKLMSTVEATNNRTAARDARKYLRNLQYAGFVPLCPPRRLPTTPKPTKADTPSESGAEKYISRVIKSPVPLHCGSGRGYRDYLLLQPVTNQSSSIDREDVQVSCTSSRFSLIIKSPFLSETHATPWKPSFRVSVAPKSQGFINDGLLDRPLSYSMGHHDGQ